MSQVGIPVRRAEPADARAIADLAAATFALACPPHTSTDDIAAHISTKLSEAAFQSELGAEGTVFYVVDDPGDVDRVIGYAMLVAGEAPPPSVEGRKPVELRRIYVAPEGHGSGIASALMHQCVRHARTHGYDLIWLGTNEENQRALRFYGREGFHIVGSRTFTVGGSVEHDHVLARPVDSELAGMPQPPAQP